MYTFDYTSVSEACQVRGWRLVQCHSAGHSPHYQIVGAPLLVNIYPVTKRGVRVYVAGTTKGYTVRSVNQILDAATRAPKLAPVSIRDKRKGDRNRRAKRSLLARDPHCQWCKKLLTLETATIEHVVPLARGGLDNMNNKALACEPCNRARGHNMPELERSA